MSEQNSGGIFKNLMWVVFATVVSVVFHGGCLALEWKLAGAPGLEGLDGIRAVLGSAEPSEGANLPDHADGTGAPSESAARSTGRSVVASAPIEANEAVYQQYMERDDVLVMVEYYADW
jgi:hypothetical protein